MKIATWNVNGIRARATEVLAWIDREAPDVVALQETKAAPAQIPAELRNLPGYHACWHGAPGYAGVALLFRHGYADAGTAPAFSHPRFDIEHRIVLGELTSHPGIVFGSVYVPNGGKDFPAKVAFIEAMIVWAGELAAAGKHLVLCGDFNVSRFPIDVHPTLRADMMGQWPSERAMLEQFYAHGLVDVGRHVFPDDDRLFTWWAPWRDMRKRNIGWRLDHVAASRALVDETVHIVHYRDEGKSDHCPVIAHLRDTPRTDLT